MMDEENVLSDVVNVLIVKEKVVEPEEIHAASVASLRSGTQGRQAAAEFQHSWWGPSDNYCLEVQLGQQRAVDKDKPAEQALVVDIVAGMGCLLACKDCVEFEEQQSSLVQGIQQVAAVADELSVCGGELSNNIPTRKQSRLQRLLPQCPQSHLQIISWMERPWPIRIELAFGRRRRRVV